MIDKQFPLYQYSVFLQGNRDEQLVIRTNTFEELIEAKKNIDRIITKREQSTPQASPNASQQIQQPNLGNCPKCNAPMIHNPKTGKNFCKDKCWLKENK